MSMQEDIKNTTHKSANEAAHIDGALAADINQLKRDTKDFSRNGKAILNDSAHVTADYLRDLSDNLKEFSRQGLKKTEARIQAKPGQSIAIAFAVGMLASLLLGRSST